MSCREIDIAWWHIAIGVPVSYVLSDQFLPFQDSGFGWVVQKTYATTAGHGPCICRCGLRRIGHPPIRLRAAALSSIIPANAITRVAAGLSICDSDLGVNFDLESRPNVLLISGAKPCWQAQLYVFPNKYQRNLTPLGGVNCGTRFGATRWAPKPLTPFVGPSPIGGRNPKLPSDSRYPLRFDATERSRITFPPHVILVWLCLLYTSPSPRDQRGSRMPSSA